VDVKANREFLRKDAELQWELSQIGSAGPNWRDEMQPAGEGDVAGGLPDAGVGGISPETPPDFGGGPAEVGTPEPVPEAEPAPEADPAV
jgi:hypothetical protein